MSRINLNCLQCGRDDFDPTVKYDLEFRTCEKCKRATAPTPPPDEKLSNPKDALGSTRAPLHLLPLPALVAWSLAHFEGGSKYGFWNWTVVGVRASIYAAAAARHLFKWFFGQDKDPVTGVHHLGYVMACCAILIDADHRAKLTDDRPPALPNLDKLFDDAESTVKKLITLYGDRAPRHYTIADFESETQIRIAEKPAA